MSLLHCSSVAATDRATIFRRQTPPAFRHQTRPSLYAESAPIGLVSEAARKGMPRIGFQGMNLRSKTIVYPGGVTRLKEIPPMLKELARSTPPKLRKKTKTGVERIPGEPLGPAKRPTLRPLWSHITQAKAKLDDIIALIKKKRGEFKQVWKNIVRWGSINRAHQVAVKAEAFMTEISDMVHQAAEIINTYTGIDSSAFGLVWSCFKEARHLHAGVMAQEALQSIEHYVISRWKERRQASFDKPDVVQETWNTADAVMHATVIADRLGGQYLEKLSRFQSIEKSIHKSTRETIHRNVEEAISLSGAIFMKTKEKPFDAIKRELELLGSELLVLERPVQSLVASVLLLEKDCSESKEITIKLMRTIEDLKQPESSKSSVEFQARKTRELQELSSFADHLTQTQEQLRKVERNLDNIIKKKMFTTDADTDDIISDVIGRISGTAALLAVKQAVADTPVVRGLVLTQHMNRIVNSLGELTDSKKRVSLPDVDSASNLDMTAEESAVSEVTTTTTGTKTKTTTTTTKGQADMKSKINKVADQIKNVAQTVKAKVPKDMPDLVASKSPARIIQGLEAAEKTGSGVSKPLLDVLAALETIKVPTGLPSQVAKRRKSVKVILKDIEMKMHVPQLTRLLTRSTMPETILDEAESLLVQRLKTAGGGDKDVFIEYM
ncbi:putative enterotoxin [Ophiocordyceps camponoti-floridani]|uniref:Putative enterotoxin n=1 Tax=Ophiocordyceps camponoti-floridani TaxID=2030778 RepID=A0A8H4VBF9_9HYPO|nr:putative enterotoxin [Ophiocordyceps camponoti-floridani]